MAEIDIIIPVYRPGDGWSSYLAREVRYQLNSSHTYSIIIVNDGGMAIDVDDKITLNRLKNCKHIKDVELIEYPNNQGKGFAIREGIKGSYGQYVVYTDDDLPYGVEAINLMIEQLSSGAEIVLPDRGADYFRSLTFRRRTISKGLILMNRVFMNMKHPDTQAGLKAINRQLADLILKGNENGFLFEVEWIKIAEKAGVSIATIPVTIKEKNVPSGVPGGDVWKLLKAYLRLFRSR